MIRGASGAEASITDGNNGDTGGDVTSLRFSGVNWTAISGGWMIRACCKPSTRAMMITTRCAAAVTVRAPIRLLMGSPERACRSGCAKAVTSKLGTSKFWATSNPFPALMLAHAPASFILM